jgi:carbon-monoxide dehydrogenase medium subunit
MKPPPFDYRRVDDVDGALEHLSEFGSDAKILAGGQSLIPMLKLRLARPSVLIDINRIRSLDFLELQQDSLSIGATCRLSALQCEMVVRDCELLTAALPFVGEDAVRNRGTLCGSLAHADPTAEMPTLACCLEAQLTLRSSRGVRTVAASEFFVSHFATALDDHELLEQVHFPIIPSSTGWSFRELSKRHAKFAFTAVTLRRKPGGLVSGARIAMGAVSDRPVRAEAAEAALEGQAGGRETFRAAAALAVEGLEPPSDVHGTAEFRKSAAEALVDRALAEAWMRARPAAD